MWNFHGNVRGRNLPRKCVKILILMYKVISNHSLVLTEGWICTVMLLLQIAMAWVRCQDPSIKALVPHSC
jgi:uncharacterized membrane protein YobD (UPF0266 family)